MKFNVNDKIEKKIKYTTDGLHEGTIDGITLNDHGDTLYIIRWSGQSLGNRYYQEGIDNNYDLDKKYDRDKKLTHLLNGL